MTETITAPPADTEPGPDAGPESGPDAGSGPVGFTPPNFNSGEPFGL